MGRGKRKIHGGVYSSSGEVVRNRLVRLEGAGPGCCQLLQAHSFISNMALSPDLSHKYFQKPGICLQGLQLGKISQGSLFPGQQVHSAVETFTALCLSAGHHNPQDGFHPQQLPRLFGTGNAGNLPPSRVLVIRAEHLSEGLSTAQTWGLDSPERKGARGLEPAG